MSRNAHRRRKEVKKNILYFGGIKRLIFRPTVQFEKGKNTQWKILSKDFLKRNRNKRNEINCNRNNKIIRTYKSFWNTLKLLKIIIYNKVYGSNTKRTRPIRFREICKSSQ